MTDAHSYSYKVYAGEVDGMSGWWLIKAGTAYWQRAGIRSASDNQLTAQEEIICGLCEQICQLSATGGVLP